MELHQLRYMVAVAHTGNFSRAADQCHVSQPSLSQQIQKLEAELGERLFDRLKRTTKLTAHGEAFLPRAIKILEEVEAVRREASDAKKLLRGTVTVGVLPTIAPYLLPRVISEFVRRYPGVEIIVQEDTTERLVKLALACEIDFALASRPLSEGRLHIRDLFSEELMLALPPGHSLARRRTIALGDLEHERLVVMADGHCLGDQVRGFCERRELRLGIAFRSAQLETVQALVRAGLGISLVPRMAMQRDRKESPIYRSLPGTRPERKIVAAWPQRRPPGRAAVELLQGIESVFQRW